MTEVNAQFALSHMGVTYGLVLKTDVSEIYELYFLRLILGNSNWYIITNLKKRNFIL